MKRFAVPILFLVFLFLFPACSIIGGNAPEGTRQDEPADAGAVFEEDSAAEEGNASGQETPGADKEDAEGEGDGVGEGEGEGTTDGAGDSSAVNAKTVKVALCFPTEDNSALIKEERDVQVIDGAILKACINALKEGPTAKGLRNPIPEGTELIGISIHDGVATVDFSREFLNTNGLEEITARMSVVNTLTGINGIEKVHFHINGEDMIGPSGQPLGDLEPVALNDDGTPVAGGIRTVTLYFADSNAEFLVGEKRDVMVTGEVPVEEIIIQELMKGPVAEELWGAIPDGTSLISAKTDNGICTVDFSSEFVDNSPGGTASERMAIYSVVNSLTELEGIKKVQFLIEGEKREVYTHATFDKPFSRFEEIIKK